MVTHHGTVGVETMEMGVTLGEELTGEPAFSSVREDSLLERIRTQAGRFGRRDL